MKDTLNSILKEYNNYTIIYGDFLAQDITKLRDEYNYQKIYVIANLPYYITTPIITKLMNEIYPDRIVIMIQEEVANRLSATCGSREYGMISVLLGSRYDIKKLFRVSRKCFVPEPNVDSAVICLDKDYQLKNIDSKGFEELIKDAFQFKRKNLRNNLKNYDCKKIESVLKKFNYSLSNRAEEIPVEVFIEIANNL